jgi:hypothetical protein
MVYEKYDVIKSACKKPKCEENWQMKTVKFGREKWVKWTRLNEQNKWDKNLIMAKTTRLASENQSIQEDIVRISFAADVASPFLFNIFGCFNCFKFECGFTETVNIYICLHISTRDLNFLNITRRKIINESSRKQDYQDQCCLPNGACWQFYYTFT